MVIGLVFAVVLARGSMLKASRWSPRPPALLRSGRISRPARSGHLRIRRPYRRHRLRRARDGPVRHRGDPAQPGQPEARDVGARQDRPVAAVGRRICAGGRPSCAAPRSARSWASCPATARCSAPFASYTVEKQLARDPSRFGQGAIEGVAGPESANNAGAQTSFIPLLTLGIPPNAVMALMVGAMTIHGIIPGPQVMTKNPNLFWGMIASMWIGNLMLVIINLPLVGSGCVCSRCPIG